MLLGQITLNISLVLYSFFYLPQLLYNIRYRRYADLSFYFHALLLLAATADLFYGFGRITQWQYRWISLLMFVCLMIQHGQLLRASASGCKRRRQLLGLTSIVLCLLGLLVWCLLQASVHQRLFVIMGWLERLGYSFYALPQWLKNHKQGSVQALSPWFLLLALVTAICDTISAWCFSWGPSSLYGAPVTVFFSLLLFCQWLIAYFYPKNSRCCDV